MPALRPTMPVLLKRAALPLGARELAQFLIGKILVRETPTRRLSGRIVETEAYLPGDAAAHSFRGETARNRSLFLERGRAYVYFIYGTWFCMNVSAEAEGVGAGVLLRALEPLEGADLMARRRPGAPAHRLASGPGCLAAALGIDRRLDGIDLCQRGPLWLGSPKPAAKPISMGRSTRIGLTKEAHRVLRYYERGSPFVSGPKGLNR